MRNWQASRANATLHNWHVKEFLLITQCDLLNASDDCFGLLQVKTTIKLYYGKLSKAKRKYMTLYTSTIIINISVIEF